MFKTRCEQVVQGGLNVARSVLPVLIGGGSGVQPARAGTQPLSKSVRIASATVHDQFRHVYMWEYRRRRNGGGRWQLRPELRPAPAPAVVRRLQGSMPGTAYSRTPFQAQVNSGGV